MLITQHIFYFGTVSIGLKNVCLLLLIIVPIRCLLLYLLYSSPLILTVTLGMNLGKSFPNNCNPFRKNIHGLNSVPNPEWIGITSHFLHSNTLCTSDAKGRWLPTPFQLSNIYVEVLPYPFSGVEIEMPHCLQTTVIPEAELSPYVWQVVLQSKLDWNSTYMRLEYGK